MIYSRLVLRSIGRPPLRDPSFWTFAIPTPVAAPSGTLADACALLSKGYRLSALLVAAGRVAHRTFRSAAKCGGSVAFLYNTGFVVLIISPNSTITL